MLASTPSEQPKFTAKKNDFLVGFIELENPTNLCQIGLMFIMCSKTGENNISSFINPKTVGANLNNPWVEGRNCQDIFLPNQICGIRSKSKSEKKIRIDFQFVDERKKLKKNIDSNIFFKFLDFSFREGFKKRSDFYHSWGGQRGSIINSNVHDILHFQHQFFLSVLGFSKGKIHFFPKVLKKWSSCPKK